MHPDANVALGRATDEPCGGYGVLDDADGDGLPDMSEAGAAALRVAPHDFAVLTLNVPVPRSWADPIQSLSTDPHRLLSDSDPVPAIADPITIVGYGLSLPPSAVTNLSSLGLRRYASTAIFAFDIPGYMGPMLRLNSLREGELSGTAPGDSGGPAFVPGSADGIFREVQLGVTQSASNNAPGVFFASLVDAANREWVQEQLDTDMDGRWDVICPMSAGLGSEPGASPTNDIDGDGLFNADDNCPAAYNPCQEDFDLDGVGDVCDSCRFISNGGAEQVLHSDTDGIPDACDNCPFVNNLDQDDFDIGDGSGMMDFGDGVGNACDNCPDALNPLQTNCNEDAETTFGAVPAGDACDPTPCGETRLEASAHDEGGGLLERVIRLDSVQVDGLVAEGAELNASTGFRFCRCAVADSDTYATRVVCLDSFDDLTGSCTLDALDSYSAGRSRESKPWRLSSIDFSTPTVGDGLGREAVVPYAPPSDMFEPDLVAQWRFDGDTARWQEIAAAEQEAVDAGLLAVGDRRFPGEESHYAANDDVPGVLWTHTTGDEDGNAFVEETRELASHYWSGIIPAAISARPPFPCLRYVGAFSPGAGCILCGQVFPRPFAGTPGVVDEGCSPAPLPPILALPELAIDLVPLLAFDPGPLFAAPELRWLTPAEPVERQPAQSIRLVAFDDSVQGGADAAVVLVDFGQGLSPVELGGQSGGDPIDPPGDVIDPPLTPFARTSVAPLSVSHAGADTAVEARVLSARRHLVWTIRSGGNVRIQHLMGGVTQVHQVEDLEARTTHAVTYREQDDRLYFVTTHTEWYGGWFPIKWVELSSMPALLASVADGGKVPFGTLETHRRWIRSGWGAHMSARTFDIVPALDGSLWLFGDLRRRWRSGPRHFVVRLERSIRPARGHRPARVRWQETNITFGDGALTELTPASDARGVSLVVERNGLEELIGYRSHALRPLRRTDMRRCF